MNNLLKLLVILSSIIGLLFGLMMLLGLFLGVSDPITTAISTTCTIPLAIALIISGRNRKYRDNQKWGFISLLSFAMGLIIIVGMIGTIMYAGIYSRGCDKRIAPGAQLSGCNFRNQNFKGINFEGAILINTKFNGANLQETNLKDSDLSNADLTGANLQEANLSNANLYYTDLKNADVTEAILTNIKLDHTNLENVKGLNDEALASVLDVSPSQLSETLARNGTRLESRDLILKTLHSICTSPNTGITETHEYVGDESFHPLIVLANNGEDNALVEAMENNPFEPMALRFTELVACISSEEETLIQTCSYTGGGWAKRYQYKLTATIRITKTGEALNEKTLYGSEPGKCPSIKETGGSSYYGDHVTVEQVLIWIEEFANFNP